jgi:serine/threonine protein kinase
MERDDKGHLVPGTTIAGYRVVRTLGSGGFGVTYEGENDLGDRVAIKEFLVRLGVASGSLAEEHRRLLDWALARFRETAIDLRKLSHPNIVNILHYVPAQDSGFVVMELVDGRTLSAHLRAHGRMSLEQARYYIAPIMDALAYVHRTGRLHRDVAPDNIMIRQDGTPVLIDFGALKAVETELAAGENRAGLTRVLTTATHAVYKQHYSAPEQREQRARLTPACDIYALACVLYRALTDKPPMDAGDRVTGLLQDGRDPAIALAASGTAGIPDHVARAIDRAMSLQVTIRPQSIAEFEAALGWDAGAGRAEARTHGRPGAAASVQAPPRWVTTGGWNGPSAAGATFGFEQRPIHAANPPPAPAGPAPSFVANDIDADRTSRASLPVMLMLLAVAVVALVVFLVWTAVQSSHQGSGEEARPAGAPATPLLTTPSSVPSPPVVTPTPAQPNAPVGTVSPVEPPPPRGTIAPAPRQ